MAQDRQKHTIVISDHQSNFGHGEIRKDFYGQSQTDIFQKGVRELVNFDITDQQTLQKRNGGRVLSWLEGGIRYFINYDSYDPSYNRVITFKYYKYAGIVFVVLYCERVVYNISDTLENGFQVYLNTINNELSGNHIVWIYFEQSLWDRYERGEGDEGTNLLDMSIPESTVGGNQFTDFYPFKHSRYTLGRYLDDRRLPVTEQIFRDYRVEKITENLLLVVNPNSRPIVIEKGLIEERRWIDRELGRKGIHEWGLEEVYEKDGIKIINSMGVFQQVLYDSVRDADSTGGVAEEMATYGFQLANIDGRRVRHLSTLHRSDSDPYEISFLYPLETRVPNFEKDAIRKRDTPLEETIETVTVESELVDPSRGTVFSSLEGLPGDSLYYHWSDYTGSLGRRTGSVPLIVFAKIKDSIMSRLRVEDGIGGYGLVRLVKIDLKQSSGGSEIDKVEGRDFLVRVFKCNGEARRIDYGASPLPFNAIIHFFLSGDIDFYFPQFGSRRKERELDIDGTTQTVSDERLGFSSFASAMATLKSANISISAISVPMCSIENGYPSSVVKTDDRTLLTGFKDGNRIYMSSSIAPLGFSQKFPTQMDFVSRIVGKILNSDSTDSNVKASSDLVKFLPGGADSSNADYVYYYQLQTQPLTGPIIREQSLEPGVSIKWAALVRELIIGTTKSEIWIRSTSGGPLSVANLNTRGWQSGRGSSSSLAEKGDYAVFFVGPRGNDLYYLYYTDKRDGMESAPATIFSGQLGQITDMKWDFNRKALWVIHGGGRIALFYMNQDVQVRGWGYYAFEEEWDALSLVENSNREIGFVTDGGKAIYIPYGEDKTHIDRNGRGEGVPVKSVVSFFRNPVTGGSSSTAVYRKKVSRTKIMTSGGTVFNSEHKDGPIIVNDEMIKDGLVVVPVSVFTEGEIIPWVTLQHDKDEDVEVLSVSSRYEVMFE